MERGQEIATLRDAKITKGTRVLIRVDYNVPMNNFYQILDDKRIVDSLPTLQYCLKKHAKVILCSHFGRPEGKYDLKYSLRPVCERLQELLPKTHVFFATDCVGDVVERQVKALPNDSILLLENTRFYPAETANDPGFAKRLAKLGDIYVDDAFGAAHRAHASTVGVAAYLPSYAGFLLEREIKYLSQITNNPKRPFTVIIGGKKIEDKMPIVEKMVDLADNILVGGRLAVDWKFTGQHRAQILVANDTKYDITPATIQKWQPVLQGSKTIFWNGPLGKFEEPQYAVGTKAIAEIVTKCNALTIAGGGDTAAAIKGYKLHHISTGGGAALEFVQNGGDLPGIKCLKIKGGK